MRAPRQRTVSLTGIAGALLGLVAATRTWVSVSVEATTVQVPQIEVTGSSAAPAVTALCVVVLAAALALLIAGRIARYVIAGITLLSGIMVAVAGVSAVLDPRAAAAAAVAEATGLRDVAGNYDLGFWPALTAAAGVLIVLQALAVLGFSHHWATSKKYDRVQRAGKPAEQDARSTHISDWEQLSAGEDPTN